MQNKQFANIIHIKETKIIRIWLSVIDNTKKADVLDYGQSNQSILGSSVCFVFSVEKLLFVPFSYLCVGDNCLIIFNNLCKFC